MNPNYITIYVKRTYIGVTFKRIKDIE